MTHHIGWSKVMMRNLQKHFCNHFPLWFRFCPWVQASTRCISVYMRIVLLMEWWCTRSIFLMSPSAKLSWSMAVQRLGRCLAPICGSGQVRSLPASIFILLASICDFCIIGAVHHQGRCVCLLVSTGCWGWMLDRRPKCRRLCVQLGWTGLPLHLFCLKWCSPTWKPIGEIKLPATHYSYNLITWCSC